MPVAFAFIGGEHQDYRYRRGIGGELTPEVDRATSNVPFVALLRGKQSFEKLSDELKQHRDQSSTKTREAAAMQAVSQASSDKLSVIE
eukprot:CAMPEP_0182530468 /NCGR_PEP_ID=MMETSP1323-20130603/5932_1 /TAXON_ID=236787 /ORGANISM="Florenciella parvula, Strain RCC1693" /LENGTH=87 /DNA_ID=CAMNT_0024739767 /DNA_START=10 /DNA_END=270 /DNA_ORIENTATION=-